MLVVGNVYGHGFGKEAIASVEAAGLTPRPEASRYAGSQLCRFIDFDEGPSLELIEVEDEQVYVDFVPKGMKPYTPGISLVVPEWAERDFPWFEQRLGELRPYRLHVNYDGTKARGRPGWNYLNFELPVIRDTFIWLTQYEEPRPRRPHVPVHANGARGIRGLVFDVGPSALARLARLAETKVLDGAVDVDGVIVWSKRAVGNLPRFGRKISPLLAVVLETADLDLLPKALRDRNRVPFGSRTAIHVPTNDLSWDLLLTGPWPADARRRA